MDEDMRNEGLENGSVDNIEASSATLLDAVQEAAPGIEETVSEAAVEVAQDVSSGNAPVPETDVDALQDVPEIQEASEIQETTVQAVSEAEPASAPAPVRSKKKKTTVGGQALIEGIMMCGPHRTAIAVRKADGSIYVEEIKKSASETFFEKVPLVRGCIRFFR